MIQDLKCNMKYNKILFFGPLSPFLLKESGWNTVHFTSVWCETKMSQTQSSGEET